MMKGIRAALVLLIVAHLIGAGLTCYAQPNISKDNIPPDVPADVREKIEALYSPDPLERAEAAAHLGLTGHRAAPAIPFLIGMFGDEALLVEDPPGSFRLPRYPVDAANSSPASQAAKTLSKIGKPAVGPLVACLRSENWFVRAYAAAALGGIEDKA
jgi:HEAT repeat protein